MLYGNVYSTAQWVAKMGTRYEEQYQTRHKIRKPELFYKFQTLTVQKVLVYFRFRVTTVYTYSESPYHEYSLATTCHSLLLHLLCFLECQNKGGLVQKPYEQSGGNGQRRLTS